MDISQPLQVSVDWRRRLVVGAALLAIALSALIVWRYAFPVGRSLYQLPDQKTGVANGDFFAFYTAGGVWRHGADPYVQGLPFVAASSATRDGRTSYIYPPTALPVFGLLSRLDYGTSRMVWLLLGLGSLAAATALAVAAASRRLETFAVICVLIAISHPLLYHINRGQSDLIVASLALASFLLYRRAGSWPSALLLAVAILAKTAPVYVLVGMSFAYRDWRFAVKTVACGLGVVALSLLVVDPHLYTEYVRTVLLSVAQSADTAANQSMVRNFDAGRVPQVLSLVAVGMFVLMTGIVGRVRGSELGLARLRGVWPRRAEVETFLLIVTLMLLFSPTAWHSWFVWTIVPAGLLIVMEADEGRRGMAVALTAAAVLWSLTVTRGAIFDLHVGPWTLYQVPVLQSPNLWGSVVAMVALSLPVMRAARRRAAASRSSRAVAPPAA